MLTVALSAQQAGNLRPVHVHRRAQHVQTHITRRCIAADDSAPLVFSAFRDIDNYKPVVCIEALPSRLKLLAVICRP
jgi:hypothetical protein